MLPKPQGPGRPLDVLAARGTVPVVPPPFTWQALDGQGWPASKEQETEFVAQLRRAAAGSSDATPTRTSTTCVLNALRCGANLNQVLDLLPGADPAEMLASYEDLHQRFHMARDAWLAIARERTEDALSDYGLAASLLMPVPVHRIRTVLSQLGDHDHDQDVVGDAVTLVTTSTRRADRVELELTRFEPRSRVAISLGRHLHDLSRPGAWSNPYYLPSRVTQLSPVRVADLRGDPR